MRIPDEGAIFARNTEQMHWLLQMLMHVHLPYSRGARARFRCHEGAGMNVVQTDWRKSRRSNPSGNCVELATLPDAMIAIRDSKDPAGPQLTFGRAEFRALVTRL